MIDAAISNVMHEMSRPLPSIAAERSAETGPTNFDGTTIGGGRSFVEGLRLEVEDFRQAVYGGLNELRQKMMAESPTAEQLINLEKAADVLDDNVDSTAREFRRWYKRTYRLSKIHFSRHVPDKVEYNIQRTAMLTLLAEYGLAKKNVIFGLRALITEYASRGESQPAFDDPEQLERHLRSLVA